ncbi:MAG: 16S rRNA (cytosine(1402)-N(4))-methyltransferase RsmH [Spirochaetes bacterium]|nr:16S rRNA (cytosine(1402)-N(4))-methyltransferase RsmH [Spirochaetota bacterium]
METTHVPVLLDECLEYLVPPAGGGLMVDATLGEGGHAEAFLSRYPELRYIGVDADRVMQGRARERLAGFGDRVRYVNAFFDEFFEGYGEGEGKAGIVLFDLGMSMFHFRESRRGFSLHDEESLDMRLNAETGRTASDLVNALDSGSLEKILRDYGEEPFSGRIARTIVESRSASRITTAGTLAEIVRRAVPAKFRNGRTHPATRTFQALRIAVNDELGRIERGLFAAVSALAVGGTIGVISFHSLEDRIVKLAFKSLFREGDEEESRFSPRYSEPISRNTERARLEPVVKKPIVPGADESRRNPASRSAKLRVARRVR